VEAALVHPIAALQHRVRFPYFLQLHPMVAVLDLKIARPAPQTGLAAVAVIQTAQAKTELQAKVIKVEIRQQLLAVVAGARLPLVQMQSAVTIRAMAATAQPLLMVLLTLAVAAVVVVVLLEAQVAPAAAVVAHTQVVTVQRVLQTLAVAVVVVVIQAEFLTGAVRLAVRVSLLFAMPIHTVLHLLLQDHPQSQLLAAIVCISGQILDQSRSNHGPISITNKR
jgi:hypothetical protein